MRGRRAWVAVAASLMICAPAGQAQTPANAGQVLTFTEDVPCPPAAATPRVHRVRHVRRRRVHPVLHRVAAPVRRPVHRVLIKRPVHRRRPAIVRAALPLPPTRCTVVRRERLTAASFGITPDAVELSPIADVVEPGGPTISPLTSGRPALPGEINPTAGGGGVSAAPEPDQWLLLLIGVGAIGVGLRGRSRRRQVRTDAAS